MMALFELLRVNADIPEARGKEIGTHVPADEVGDLLVLGGEPLAAVGARIEMTPAIKKRPAEISP